MEKDLSPEQSLATIQAMINEAKQSVFKMGFMFILWGAVLEACGIGQFVLDRMGFSMPWIIWPVLCTIGGIAASIHGARQGSKLGANTFTDRVTMWLWVAFTITLVLVIIGSVSQDMDPGSYIMLITGLPTLVTGTMLRFRPLVVGAILFWIIGLLSFWFLTEYRSLVFSFAIVVGYVIPGIMLKLKEDGVRPA